jgi:hypothetical protein
MDNTLDQDPFCHFPITSTINWYYVGIGLPFSTLFLFGALGLYMKATGKSSLQMIDQALSKILMVKLYMVRFYMAFYDRFIAQKGFRLKRAHLRSSLPELHCVVIDCLTSFKKRTIEQIDPHLFKDLCNVYGYDPQSAYLELHYYFNDQEYTFIYSHTMANNGTIVPYPLYHDEKIREFKADICHPHFTKPNSQNSLYSLFGIDCKGIKGVRFNGDPNHRFNAAVGERVMKHKGPLNDFGYLYQGDTRVKHILEMDHLKEFKSLEIEYVAPYLDEDTFDIVPHVIQVDSLNDHLLSPRMRAILENRRRSERR